MPRFHVVVVAGVVALAALAPQVASAHFILQAPPNWAEQDPTGLPEKSAPCGQADPGTPAVQTNVVTPFHPGDTITVSLTEAIFHPGHYRVALSTTDQSGLPPEPQVTVGATPCGSAAIESPPVFPVLADDMLDHTAAFSAPQSFQVTLPIGVTCSNCVLQVIEFMSDHPLNSPGGCFYHHCANISIEAATGAGGAAGGQAGGGGEAGSGAGGGDAAVGGGAGSGCGCLVGGALVAPTWGWFALGAIVVLFSRGRSRARRNRLPVG